jgi:hypothetical protein
MIRLFSKLVPCTTADLVDFSKLTQDYDLEDRRTRNTARIEALKIQMGDKYLLAKPIQRKLQ